MEDFGEGREKISGMGDGRFQGGEISWGEMEDFSRAGGGDFVGRGKTIIFDILVSSAFQKYSIC